MYTLEKLSTRLIKIKAKKIGYCLPVFKCYARNMNYYFVLNKNLITVTIPCQTLARIDFDAGSKITSAIIKMKSFFMTFTSEYTKKTASAMEITGLVATGKFAKNSRYSF
jgi:hypothetical protein